MSATENDKQKDKPFSVLIVDDNEGDIAALNEILKADCVVRASKNGGGAIKRAVLNKPDLIMLDIVMPDISGFEVLTTLRELEHTKDVPIIFITSDSAPETERKALEMGAADVILKPFTPSAVKARVQKQLSGVC